MVRIGNMVNSGLQCFGCNVWCDVKMIQPTPNGFSQVIPSYHSFIRVQFMVDVSCNVIAQQFLKRSRASGSNTQSTPNLSRSMFLTQLQSPPTISGV